MADEKLEERRKALEEAFFRKRNRELIAKLRAEEEAKGRKRALSDVSGIRDDSLLDKLVAAGVHSEVLAAFSLTPLIAVAWADRQIDEKERTAVLAAAEQLGMSSDGAAYGLLRSWLEHRPGPELFDAWAAFVKTPRSNLSAAERERLKSETLERTRKVAAAAGGLLGLGTVGPAERELLGRIERAFDA
jgi:hypothetical protein